MEELEMQMQLDLYVDYLLCSTIETTATGLSSLTDNAISHDKVTRFLSARDYTASDLWKIAKPMHESIKDEDGVLIIDDSIQEKPYTDENELIAWHHCHTKNRAVKGINFVSALYHSPKGVVPVGYELVRKTMKVVDKKSGKERRKSPVSKHKNFRDLVCNAVTNNVKFKHVLADSWYSSIENMNFIKNEMKRHFIMPVKSNRKVALSESDKAAGKFVRIDSLEPRENVLVRLEGVDFPLRFTRQVFKNEDGSTGILYLVSSDIELTNEQIQTIYKKRWKVETYHQSLKNNASLAKSPAKKPRTQANHLFASLCAYIRLEQISARLAMNHFSLKAKIYLRALKVAMLELQKLSNTIISQIGVSDLAPA
jgi:Transposase DDE domain